MYFEDCKSYHFHPRYGEFKAEIVIEDLSLKFWTLPPTVLGLVIEWAAKHKEDLIVNWNLLFEKGLYNKIEPSN